MHTEVIVQQGMFSVILPFTYLFCLNMQHIKVTMKTSPSVQLTSMGTSKPAEQHKYIFCHKWRLLLNNNF